ncbi:MAG: SUMF1/EgtB/PvdO family nonheme iron enzyme [Ardenticatenia bacterium]|nr:SUMF1/EgtB/PvdO family nonheme iron enzyme [Ardenticatenia bacterium]
MRIKHLLCMAILAATMVGGGLPSAWQPSPTASLPVPLASPTPTAPMTPAHTPARAPTAAPAVTSTSMPVVVLTIGAYIDGRSQLVVQSGAVHWHHLDWAAPGRNSELGEIKPTFLNGAAWCPTWPDSPDAENRDCGCDSSTYVGIPPLAMQDQTVGLKADQARAKVTIVQQPQADNSYTLIVEFDDNDPLGADWYEVDIGYIAGGQPVSVPMSDGPCPTPIPAVVSTSPTPSQPGAADACGDRGEITKVVGSPIPLQPANILLQLAWERGFTRPQLGHGGSFPDFTLLTDGRAFYKGRDDPSTFDRGQAMVVHLTPAERQELVQRVLDLGFERLESYPDSCRPLPNGLCECIEDASESILRLRLESGELREVRNYHTFANDPDALAAIRALLEGYQHPKAEPYVPEKAALFIQAVEATAALDWPLDPAVLAPAVLTTAAHAAPCQVVLSGSDLETLLSVTGRNIGDFLFRAGDRVYAVYLVPWLPGVDYTDLIASSGQACPALPPPLPTPVSLPGMPQPGATMTRPMTKDEMVMRYVPAGPFYMGSPESVGESIEHPQHVVTLNAFWIDETEVTRMHYETCVAAGVCDVPPMDDDALSGKPVVVTWSAAQAYCHWAGGRLPTEAEWEKAARGSDACIYPWGEERPDCSRANHMSLEGPCSGGPVDAGACPAGASPYGVLDMAGNVTEWVSDWYDPGYYAVSPQQNPQGPDSGQARVARGGSWDDTFSAIRAAYRNGYAPDDVAIGFRCVVPAAVYTVVESDPYDGWYRYTNLDYGFSFHYPPDWTLEDRLHLLILRHEVVNTLRFTVEYRRVTGDLWVFRTGMPAGDFVSRGSVRFLGRELSRDVLVYEGRDILVSYSYGNAMPWGDVAFFFVLEDYRSVDLPKDMQSQIDQVVTSFELEH